MKHFLLALVCLATVAVAQTTVPEAPQPVAQNAAAPAPTLTADPKAVTVTVSLNGNPTTGVCPYTMNISWSAQNASDCAKSGVWGPGSVGASGSESIQINSASNTFTLTCSSATDSRTVSWVNPTQNTDGTAVILTGNKVWSANSSANITNANPITLSPATTSYVLAGLPAGSRYVGIMATSKGGDSAMSNLANTTISLPTGTATVTAGCTAPPPPKPPTAVTIAQTVWETVKTASGLTIGRDVGNVEMGIKCNGKAPIIKQSDTEYWVVQKKLATLYAKPLSTYVVSQCQVPS